MLINGVNLQYQYDRDAGYDLMLNLDSTSTNSTGLLNLLEENISPNLNFYSSYLPKLYINGEYIGELTDNRSLSIFSSQASNDSPFVLLPPLRVGHIELNSILCNFSNTELVKTSFDFEVPTRWSELTNLFDAVESIIDNYLTTKIPVGKFYNYFDSDLEKYINFVGLVYPRSGLATKHQITISNNVGVVDAKYTNNVMVGLENRGRDFHLLTNSCRVAQLVITPILNNPYDLKPLKGNDSRNQNGFGSTGV
jgi:hypothetical protein